MQMVVAAYKDHVHAQFMDRAVDDRIASMAEQAARGEVAVESPHSILNFCLDGMDQAKFRIPRNFSLSKDFQMLWRPTLHVAGSIADGLNEAYFLAGPDVSKASLAPPCRAQIDVDSD